MRRALIQKFIVIVCMLAMLFIIWSGLAGCVDTPASGNGAIPTGTPQPSEAYEDNNEQEVNHEQSEHLDLPPSYFDFPEPEAPGTKVVSNDFAIIDYSNNRLGYIMVKTLRETQTEFRLLINGPGEQQYNFLLGQNSDFQAFPLAFGNGVYRVGVFERIDGNRFATVLSENIDVYIEDEFAPFLRSNQYVNFNRSTKAVSVAAALVAGLGDTIDKVEAIYTFVIDALEYDDELAKSVQTGYIPDLDEVLRRGRGICFDYASLMTAMLRSQGIPTKLVIGYVGDVYHAWINVYTEEYGWVGGLIRFDGNEWTLMDPTFTSNSNDPAIIDFIGDGTNYHPMFVF